MIEQSNLEKNLKNKLRIEDLKIVVGQWSPRNRQFTTVYQVGFGRLYLFT
jgi:hypothetical protein